MNNDKIDRLIVADRLKALFKNEWFNICVIDDCVKILNIVIPAQDYYRMRALHCVQYREMRQEVREWLFAKVLESFQEQSSFNTSLIDTIVAGNSPEQLIENMGFVKKRGFLGFLKK